MRFKNQSPNDDFNQFSEDEIQRPCGSYNQMQQMTPMPQMQQMPQMMQMPAVQPGYQPSVSLQQPLPGFPSGFPTGGTTTPLLQASTGAPAVPIGEQPPTTVQSTLFTPGYLRTQIGKRMRVQFLIGTNMLTDRVGTLVGVGASFILLRPVDSDDTELCDIYSIKFVTILK